MIIPTRGLGAMVLWHEGDLGPWPIVLTIDYARDIAA